LSLQEKKTKISIFFHFFSAEKQKNAKKTIKSYRFYQ
jgi:hypothetical protein